MLVYFSQITFGQRHLRFSFCYKTRWSIGSSSLASPAILFLQLSKLFDLIDAVVNSESGNHFTSEMFQVVQREEDQQRQAEEQRLGN